MNRIIYVLFVLSSFFAKSQVNTQLRTCGTPTLPIPYEAWLNSLVQSGGPKGSSASNIQSVFNIPVIVHIIHNNEAVNANSATSGNNISAQQVLSQLNILNKDFNGVNTDTTLIPTVFKPFHGKLQVNFCLAVVNPTGGILAEPGIDRINRVAKGWNSFPYSQTYVDATVKPNSIWDPNKYLNIWICPLSSGLLGYATFPNPGTSGLSGLTGSFGSNTTDGVVILNTSFGNVGTAQFGQYNQGRTATHEIGHWMGLRHIWGDGTCATDYVNDTPPAQNANYGCPNFPYKLGVCTGNTTGEMTMNFMDYTDDACMYLFTKDQKIRTQLIMVNSPMRTALLSSTVCNLPSIVNDPALIFVARPTYSQALNCYNFIDPIISITNFGTSTLTSLLVTYNVDGINTQTINWTGSLNPTANFTLALPQISGLGNGAHTFSANISAPNGGTDNNLANNSNVQQFTIANAMSVTVNSPSTCANNAVTLNASGASTYTWTNVGTGASVSVSPSVTTVYTLTAATTTCSVVKTTTVNVTPGPTITVNLATACGGVTSTLTASGALSYSWNSVAGAASTTVNPQTTTIYTVSGIGSNGCVGNKTSTVNVLFTPTVSANNVTVCSGVTATLSANGATTYSWNTGSSSQVVTVSPVSNTTYTVTGTTGTCADTKTVSVTIGSALSIYVSPVGSQICTGKSQTLTATGANSYTWSTGSNGAVLVVSPTNNTVYTVNGSAASCPGSATVSVNVNALPVTVLGAQNVPCFGGVTGSISANSTGSGPFTYAYSSGSVNLSAGVYSVTTTDVNGCQSTGTVNITQPSQIALTATVGASQCSGSCDGSAQLTISGGTSPYTNTIYPSASPGTVFNSLCAGSYSAYITDNNGCVSINTFSIPSNNAGVSISTTVTNVSCGSCANATLTASGTSGTAPYTYTWIPGNFFAAVLVDVPVGCYTVTVKDSKGCFSEKEECVSFDLGIADQKLQSTLKLSPNPTSGIIQISGMRAEKTLVEVYDARGRLIISKTTNEESFEINLSNLSEGIYYARFIAGEQTAVARIIKL